MYAMTCLATGARVSNAYGTNPQQGDNPEKSGLIPHSTGDTQVFSVKEQSVADGHAFH